MKRIIVVRISFIIFLISLTGLFFFPQTDRDAVKYVNTENGPRFRTFELEKYDVTEYEEGQYYLVDKEGNITKTDAQSWKKSWMMEIFVCIIKSVLLLSFLIFAFTGWFYPLFKTVITQKNYILPK